MIVLSSTIIIKGKKKKLYIKYNIYLYITTLMLGCSVDMIWKMHKQH